jgi:hypothetical protein
MDEKKFQEMFGDDKKCQAYIFRLRAVNNKFLCTLCGNPRIGKPECGVFRCKKCRNEMSILQGTLFEHTHILIDWFKAIWLIAFTDIELKASELEKEIATQNRHTTLKMVELLEKILLRIAIKDPLYSNIKIDEKNDLALQEKARFNGADVILMERLPQNSRSPYYLWKEVTLAGSEMVLMEKIGGNTPDLELLRQKKPTASSELRKKAHITGTEMILMEKILDRAVNDKELIKNIKNAKKKPPNSGH